MIRTRDDLLELIAHALRLQLSYLSKDRHLWCSAIQKNRPLLSLHPPHGGVLSSLCSRCYWRVRTCPTPSGSTARSFSCACSPSHHGFFHFCFLFCGATFEALRPSVPRSSFLKANLRTNPADWTISTSCRSEISCCFICANCSSQVATGLST